MHQAKRNVQNIINTKIVKETPKLLEEVKAEILKDNLDSNDLKIKLTKSEKLKQEKLEEEEKKKKIAANVSQTKVLEKDGTWLDIDTNENATILE